MLSRVAVFVELQLQRNQLTTDAHIGISLATYTNDFDTRLSTTKGIFTRSDAVGGVVRQKWKSVHKCHINLIFSPGKYPFFEDYSDRYLPYFRHPRDVTEVLLFNPRSDHNSPWRTA